MSCKIKVGSKECLLKVQIEGNATWENAAFFLDFIKKFAMEGKNKILIDLGLCTFLDSTYFGVIAELSDFLNIDQDSEIFLPNMNERVQNDIRTVGLDKLVSIADPETVRKYHDIETTQSSFDENYSKIQKAKQILKAHQTLEKLNLHNKEEFQDVIKYFQDYLE